jgi:polyhydroxybutyrate depolymerase
MGKGQRRPYAIALVALAAALSACGRRAAEPRAQGGEQSAAGSETVALQHGGRNRRYILYRPRTVPIATPSPLLIALHGGGGNAAGFQAYAGLDSVADREGFLVVYPEGTSALGNLRTWNAGDCCGYAMNQNVDDVGFIDALLDDVARRTRVDARRIYATGHSNGAMMVYRLAAERAERIAAIAPVAGAYNTGAFAPSRPVAVMHIHSVDDPRALYNGGVGPPFPGTNVRSRHRSVMEGIGKWLQRNGCAPEPRTLQSVSGRARTVNAGQTATLLSWPGCATSGPVAHWKLTGAGHGWPGHVQPERREDIIGPSTTIIGAAEEVWKFVSAIRR